MNHLRPLAFICVVLGAGLPVSRSQGAEPISRADFDAVLKSLQKNVPEGWRVSGELSPGLAWYRVASPNTMVLHGTLSGNLPTELVNRKARNRCEMLIYIGERLSVGEQTRRAKIDQTEEHYQGEKEVWIPHFYDDHFGFEIKYPTFLPDKKEDRQAVVDCYKVLVRHWTVYPATAEASDAKHLADYLASEGAFSKK